MIAEVCRNRFKDLTYKIKYESRLTSFDSKNALFSTIHENMNLRVDLSSPQVICMVQIIKNYLGLTVMENDSLNFNLSTRENQILGINEK
jgi:tRNA(Ser,Leu) C12 N-acetylase TAN1